MIKCDFLLRGFCLLFICLQTVHAGFQEKLFFDCRDGQPIPSNKKCDAYKDCRDGSDETFVECRKVICPELTCSYGGCYKESQLCDGYFDCWDHTDEHPEYCSPNLMKIPAIEDGLQPRCENNQFKCKNSTECLDLKFICDGVKDCQDGSDETHANCLISKCPKDTFRCAYGGCLAQAKACDHLVHCWDRSDELAAICSGNGTSNWNIYRDPPRRTGRTTPMNTRVDSVRSFQESGCRVPRNLKHLQVKTLFNVLPYQPGVPIAESTVVRLLCLDNTELYGSDLNHCLNGQWQGPWPACKETCRRTFSRDTSIRVTCMYNGQMGDCNHKDVKLLPGTTAFISCAPSYLPQDVLKPWIERTCTEDPAGKKRPYWSLAAGSKRLHCFPDCGRKLPTVKQDPWIVSLFTSDITMRNFSFNCLGYIISPWAVLVAKKCIYTGDVLRYAIAEGQHNVGYTESDEHTYQLHSVESIFKSEKHAVLKLVNPFILTLLVRPICLPPIRNWYALTSNSTAVVRKNGQDISYLINIEEDILRHTELIRLN